MRVTPTRGALIGLAMVAAVFAAAGANFAASEDPAVPTQWTVGGDGKFAGESDDSGVELLELPSAEPLVDTDVFGPLPADN